MKRIVAFSYGTLCYLVFLATFVYAVLFLGNVGLSRTIDGEATAPFWHAMLINTLLLGLFAVQHSVMARPAFKAGGPGWSRSQSSAAPMCCFQAWLCSCSSMTWQPMGGVVWDVEDPIGRNDLIACLLGAGYWSSGRPS